MNKSVIVSKHRSSLSQSFSHLGMSEPTWVLIHVWDGRDPDSPGDPPKSKKGKPPSNELHVTQSL